MSQHTKVLRRRARQGASRLVNRFVSKPLRKSLRNKAHGYPRPKPISKTPDLSTRWCAETRLNGLEEKPELIERRDLNRSKMQTFQPLAVVDLLHRLGEIRRNGAEAEAENIQDTLLQALLPTFGEKSLLKA